MQKCEVYLLPINKCEITAHRLVIIHDSNVANVKLNVRSPLVGYKNNIVKEVFIVQYEQWREQIEGCTYNSSGFEGGTTSEVISKRKKY